MKHFETGISSVAQQAKAEEDTTIFFQTLGQRLQESMMRNGISIFQMGRAVHYSVKFLSELFMGKVRSIGPYSRCFRFMNEEISVTIRPRLP